MTHGNEPPVWWGTNRANSAFYAGRTHVVWPSSGRVGLCGLPVDDLWELRPSVPELLCPDCCLLAMAALFPAFPHDTRAETGRHDLAPPWPSHDTGPAGH
ncbi:hypothetical protein [Actinoalloteichus spitiensis]|uniref:hypothetical protein n=1 Tax=Actinoalloteichus spitiensis TaxID=252394 RepID=UPI00038229FF|nr:hypothetical protein [Actinoalloteichus spitiensis]